MKNLTTSQCQPFEGTNLSMLHRFESLFRPHLLKLASVKRPLGNLTPCSFRQGCHDPFKQIPIWLILLCSIHQPLLSQPGPSEVKRPLAFKSSDGYQLQGDYYAGENERPGLLLIHMCNVGHRQNYNGLARTLAENRFNVLSFDFRGHGESRTSFLDVEKDREAFWEEESGMIYSDIEAAYQLLLSMPEVDTTKMGIVAASCGVKRAMRLAEYDHNIKALVLLSGSADPEGIKYLSANDQVAVFGIAAEDDGEGIAAQWIRELAQASSNSQSRKLVFKSGGHGTELFQSKKDLGASILTWLNDVLDD